MRVHRPNRLDAQKRTHSSYGHSSQSRSELKHGLRMPTTPIDILTKQSCLKNKPPLLRCASYFLSQILKAWKIQREKNKKQSTRIINAKHKNQNLKVLFSNPLYIQFLSVFFFTSYFPSYNLPSMSVFIDVLCMSSWIFKC